MGKAYVCDRCGELFKPSDYEPDIPIVLDMCYGLELW